MKTPHATAATVFAALISLPAYATEHNTNVSLQEVKVSGERSYNSIATEKGKEYSSFAATVGTKIPASMREIPQSISIITHQQVKDRNVNTLDQLARKTPGLNVLSNDDGRSSVFARGYEYDEYNIDGLPAQMQSINGTLPNLIAFDRVEIMRGPSGLFDSSGEMGGIVNLVRKRPSKDFQANIGAGYGTQQHYEINGDVSGRLNADGNLRGRILAQTTGESPKPAEKNNHHATLYGALDFDISPHTTAGVGYLFQTRNIVPNNGLPVGENNQLLPLPNHTFVGASWNKFRMKSHDVFADIKHYFPNGGYGKIAMRYSTRRADSNYFFAGSQLSANSSVTPQGLGTQIEQKAFAADASYSQPFTLGTTANHFVVGMDFNHFTTYNEQGRTKLRTPVDYRQFSNIAYTNILANAIATGKGYSTADTKLDETGLYSKAVFRPLSDLSLIAGGRLGHYKLTSGDGQNSQKRSDTQLTSYAGAVWDFSEQNSLYASYSSLFTPQTALDSRNQILKPRQGQQIEVGYKGSYLNDKLNTRLSLYRLQDKNAAAPSASGDGSFVATGKRVMKGWEAEVSGDITPKWKIHAGYSHLLTHIKTASTAKDDGIFLLMPKHSGNIWTSYDITPKLTIGGGINAMSSIRSAQGYRAGGYATLDAMASYQFTSKLQAQLNIDNLLNRQYYTRVGSAGTFNIPSKERSVMANIRYTF